VIGSALDFELSDEQYSDFIAWLADKEYDYTTKVEKNIENLIESAKEEKYYEDIKDQIDDLKKATLHNKEMDLESYREEIKVLLEQEIASRYYLEKGMIESTFQEDKDILTAVKILENDTLYFSMLK
jgi:carboxyl-terminal processing protease